MSVFYVHDASRGIITPLNRKFRVREISPTDELTAIQPAHRQDSAHIPDKFDDQHAAQGQTPQNDTQAPGNKLAAQAYQSTRDPDPIGKILNLGRVENIMTTPVLTADTTQSLADAWQIMQKYEVHHLAIIDAQGDFCGMVSEKNILPYLMMSHVNTPDNTKLNSFCQQSSLSTHTSTSVTDLATVMLEYGLRGIAVTENGKLIGIVTYSDILKVVLKNQAIDYEA